MDAALSFPWLQAISYTTHLLLSGLGLSVVLGSMPGDAAILSMEHIVFQVTR